MSIINCAVQNCKTTILNKGPGVTLHSCPTNTEMRNKWLHVLKNKCIILDWAKSKICSKHFENKYFNSQRKLSDNAIPTLFTVNTFSHQKTPTKLQDSSKIDKLLNKMSQAELNNDIKNNMSKLKEPLNLDSYVTDNLKCKPDTPMEIQLWLMIKKQDNLNARLNELVVQTKKHADAVQKNLEGSNIAMKEYEQNIESLKYVVKCLQEKHATLEEQIEILTAVESR